MKTILWIFTLAGCVSSVVLLVLSFRETPEYMAIIAIVIALIPYVITNAVIGIYNDNKK